MTEHDILVPAEQRGRQAMAGLTGYLHQILATVGAWMRLGADETLLIEFAEDYAVVASDALTMTQVKRVAPSKTFSLNRLEARKAILSLWQFANANPKRDVSLHFLTTAGPAHEHGLSFPDGASGVDYWRQAALGADPGPLRAFLLSLEWPKEFAEQLAGWSDEDLREQLIKRLEWFTGADPSPVLVEALEARLGERAVQRGLSAVDGVGALPALFFRVTQTVLNEERCLTAADFEEAWAAATDSALANLSRRITILESSAIGSSAPKLLDNLDPLPNRLAPRTDLVQSLADVLRRGSALWLHGSSGLGKSRLSQLIARHVEGHWHVVRLRNLKAADAVNALKTASAALDAAQIGGVVLDDLPVPLTEPLVGWVRALAQQAAQVRAKLLVTSERAPLPTTRASLEPYPLEVRVGPYLTTGDVADIVSCAGGDPDTWASIIHLSCGGGHPLFVDARVAGLASRGWPKGEYLKGLMEPATEVDEVRQEVALRLLQELDANSHVLLLRLSALITPFDRELVVAVAASDPPLPRPGVLFDYLVGPWIESAGEEGYRLSPLLATTGAKALEPGELKRVRSAIIEHLLCRRPFPSSLLSELLLQGMIIRHLGAFQFVAGAVLVSEHRRLVADQCLPLRFLSSKEDGRLVPEHPGISASLRIAQIIALAAQPFDKQLTEAIDEAELEFGALPEPMRSVSLYTMIISLLSERELDAPPSFWLPLLKRYCAIVDGGTLPPEVAATTEGVDLNGLSPDEFFFAIRAGAVRTPDELNTIFGQLEDVHVARRHGWLTASSRLTGGPPLFIQTAWSRAAQAEHYDAGADVVIYRHLAERAVAWGELETAVECHRAAATLLDEYVGDRDAALRQLNEAETLDCGKDRVVRSKATVLAHQGRHVEADELLTSLRETYSIDEPLERALMLQAAANSAARAGDRRRAASLFRQAHEVGLSSTLSPGVKIGLLCDAAVEEGAAGDFDSAIRVLAEAFVSSTAIEASSEDRDWFAIQAVSQVAVWLSNQQEGRQSLPLAERPGSWSLLDPAYPEDRTGAVPLDHGLANAAMLEQRLELDVGLGRQFFDREESLGAFPLLSMAVRGAKLARMVDDRNVDGFLEQLPMLVSVQWAALKDKQSGSTVRRLVETQAPENWDEPMGQSARHLASELVAELLLDGDGEKLDLAIERLESVSPFLRFNVVDEGPTDYVGAALTGIRTLATSAVINPQTMLLTSFHIFQWLTLCSRELLRHRVWIVVREGWRTLAEQRGYLLTSPGRVRPLIVAAAAKESGTLGDFADLIEAGIEGTGFNLPTHAKELLARHAQACA